MTENIDNSKRNRRQDEIIVALLENPTLEKAAAAAGISSVTLWRSMQEPEFQEAYRQARRNAFSQSIARLQHASNAAVGTLLRVMTDREAPAASRVRAADVVLQAALRGMETEDIEARVTDLERSTQTNQRRGAA
ncbi:MAG: hypothetical protein ABI995_05050 [Acidobacteriota bacterium]